MYICEIIQRLNTANLTAKLQIIREMSVDVNKTFCYAAFILLCSRLKAHITAFPSKQEMRAY
jgi:hypothetical protein